MTTDIPTVIVHDDVADPGGGPEVGPGQAVLEWCTRPGTGPGWMLFYDEDAYPIGGSRADTSRATAKAERHLQMIHSEETA